MKLAIRVDAGTTLGMGHLMRCVAITHVLPAHWHATFYLLETDEPVYLFLREQQLDFHILTRTANEVQDAQQFLKELTPDSAVLLDSYALQTQWQQSIKDAGHLLYVIDDLHAWHHVADHLINHAGGVSQGDYQCDAHCQIHLGYGYRMLRKVFMSLQAPRALPLGMMQKVLISMGASDVPNNTLKIAKACQTLTANCELHVLVSRLNPHLEELQTWHDTQDNLVHMHYDLDANSLYQLMANCDTLICPASTIALEGCSVGMHVLVGITAQNQIDNYHGLINQNFAHPLGNLNDAQEESIVSEIREIIAQPIKCQTIIQNQKHVFHAGNHQLPLLFESIAPRLRRVSLTDVMTLYHWANDPDVRANSFDSNPIPLEAHAHWLEQKLVDENTVLYILHDDHFEFGVIRFTRQDQVASISPSRQNIAAKDLERK